MSDQSRPSTDDEETAVVAISVADRTWRSGFLHLTVDSDGLASLWDREMNCGSYVRLPLTAEQVELLESVAKRGGHTP